MTGQEKLSGQELVDALRNLRRQRFDRLRRIAKGDESVTAETLDGLLTSCGLALERFEAWVDAGGAPRGEALADDVQSRERLLQRRSEVRREVEIAIEKLQHAERNLEGLREDLANLQGERTGSTRFHNMTKSEREAGIPGLEQRIAREQAELDRLREQRKRLVEGRDRIDGQLAELVPA